MPKEGKKKILKISFKVLYKLILYLVNTKNIIEVKWTEYKKFKFDSKNINIY
jgi:hypothetical protein